MSVKILYFVHGTTLDNLEHKSTGWFPGKLSEKGIRRNIELRDKIDINSIDLVISSDLQRAKDSTYWIFENKKEVLYDDRIRECNYGDLNGENSSLIKYEEHIDIPFQNGESLKDVEKRVRKFCEFLLNSYDKKTIALVSHKAPQLALDVITKKISWNQAIEQDWRKTKKWQPGWTYEIKNSDI